LLRERIAPGAVLLDDGAPGGDRQPSFEQGAEDRQRRDVGGGDRLLHGGELGGRVAGGELLQGRGVERGSATRGETRGRCSDERQGSGLWRGAHVDLLQRSFNITGLPAASGTKGTILSLGNENHTKLSNPARHCFLVHTPSARRPRE